MSAKNFRMQKFFYPNTNKGLIVPIDHGVTVGALDGLRNFREIASWISNDSITGVIAHKGMALKLTESGLLQGKALMIHLNGMSTLSKSADTKVNLTSVEEALRLGADALSFQVNFNGANDDENLSLMGETVDKASAYGLPVLAMVYDKVKESESKSIERIKHLVRIAFELGCSAVKIAPPLEIKKTLEEMTEMIPVFLAGGSLVSEKDLLTLTESALSGGASGLCVGRNIFERNNPSLMEGLKNLLTQKSREKIYFTKERQVAAH